MEKKGNILQHAPKGLLQFFNCWRVACHCYQILDNAKKWWMMSGKTYKGWKIYHVLKNVISSSVCLTLHRNKNEENVTTPLFWLVLSWTKRWNQSPSQSLTHSFLNQIFQRMTNDKWQTNDKFKWQISKNDDDKWQISKNDKQIIAQILKHR